MDIVHMGADGITVREMHSSISDRNGDLIGNDEASLLFSNTKRKRKRRPSFSNQKRKSLKRNIINDNAINVAPKTYSTDGVDISIDILAPKVPNVDNLSPDLTSRRSKDGDRVKEQCANLYPEFCRLKEKEGGWSSFDEICKTCSFVNDKCKDWYGICPLNYWPVCATFKDKNGETSKNFGNWCDLKGHVCMNYIRYIDAYNGRCGEMGGFFG